MTDSPGIVNASTFHFVIDTNIGIKQFINDPLTQKVEQLLGQLSNPSVSIFIPDLFYIEIANVLRKYVRANLYAASQARSDLDDLEALPFDVTPTQALMQAALDIAIAKNISAYDACYVALSERVKAPLLTLDKRLVNSLTNSPYDVRLFNDFEIET
ncbi:MAG: type II toxin-antitoxin system VapC family toxin [Cyanobacteria bacterium P01_D01_bin.56]